MSPPATAGGAHPGPLGGRPAGPTVFFLSDYGLADEFVGVVHAVVLRLAPGATVVDLAHGVAPFDVRAGSEVLVRAVPHLGPGVVLGVIDPGVGGVRRGVAIEAGGRPNPGEWPGRWFVGPDNGLLVAGAELCGGIRRVVELVRPVDVPDTFDGRDVFAPAAAALATGTPAEDLGVAFPPGDLVRLAPPRIERETVGGRRILRAEVTWVDRFGNVQLAVEGAAVPSTTGAGPDGEASEARTGGGLHVAVAGSGVSLPARRVRTFSQLAPGELGVVSDANGRAALVVREGSAAAVTGAAAGAVVELSW